MGMLCDWPARRDYFKYVSRHDVTQSERRPDCTMENFYTSLLYSMNAIPLSLAFASRRGGQAALDLLLQHLQLALHLVPLLQLRATIAIDVTQIALLRSGKGAAGAHQHGAQHLAADFAPRSQRDIGRVRVAVALRLLARLPPGQQGDGAQLTPRSSDECVAPSPELDMRRTRFLSPATTTLSA